MLIETPTNVLASSGLQSTHEFQIKTSATAFKILSSGLYSDKILAVLRELSANACDAHIAAGIPNEPIEVKLPTRIDQTFYVKDRGPGLSEKDIYDLYTTYFGSSKSQSNDFTGAFGLGSKSPFSYTDKFTVVSAHDGTETTYAAYLSDSGTPAISKITSTPASSEWRTGLRVSMPIAAPDIHKFHENAIRLFRFFRVTPKVLSLNGKITKPEYTRTTPEYSLVKPDGNGAENTVVMGNIPYPVNLTLLKNIKHQEWLKNMTFHFTLPIGSVDITASREHLEYTPKTIAKLSTLVDDAILYNIKQSVEDIRAATKDLTLANARKISQRHQFMQSMYNGQRKRFLMLGGMTDQEATRVDTIWANYVSLPQFLGSAEVQCFLFWRTTTREISTEIFKGLRRARDTSSPANSYSWRDVGDFYIADSKHARARVREVVAQKRPPTNNFDHVPEFTFLLIPRTNDPKHLETLLKRLETEWYKVEPVPTSTLADPQTKPPTKRAISSVENRLVWHLPISEMHHTAHCPPQLANAQRKAFKDVASEPKFFVPYAPYFSGQAALDAQTQLQRYCRAGTLLENAGMGIPQSFITVPANTIKHTLLESLGYTNWIDTFEDVISNRIHEERILKNKLITWYNLPSDYGINASLGSLITHHYALNTKFWALISPLLNTKLLNFLKQYPQPNSDQQKIALAYKELRSYRDPLWKNDNALTVQGISVVKNVEADFRLEPHLGQYSFLFDLIKGSPGIAAEALAPIINARIQGIA